MSDENAIPDFLSGYPETIKDQAMRLRKFVLENLPAVTEQLDLPAKMIAYSYGLKYGDLICVIIPSQKGLKLGFNRGTELHDPAGLLQGTGKISRYVEIKSDIILESAPLKELMAEAFLAFKKRS